MKRLARIALPTALLLIIGADPRCVEYSSPPSRCPALACKETGQVPCVTDDDCTNPAQSCQATECQSRCAFTRIQGECCDRPEDCASNLCIITAAPPGTCGVGATEGP